MINWLAMITSRITNTAISAHALAVEVADQSAGATVTFSGDVRNHDKSRQVLTLTYEVHPTAENVIQMIANEVSVKYKVIKVSLAHRYGAIPIGETAFAVAVSAEHREAAFDCCRELVERVKSDLPIWKFQEFADGTTEWVNSA